MNGTQGNFLENLREAIRENPVAAALIGGGALWLLTGNEKLKSAASKANAAAAPLADIGARNFRSAAPKFANSPPTAPDQDLDNESSQHVKESLRDAKSAVSDAASDAAGATRDRLEEGITFAREKFGKLGDALPRKETLAQVQSSVSGALERQPLLLGAIGVAVGAVLGGAFSTSDLENEWVGELSDNVKEDLNARAGAVSRSVREASDTLKAEIDDMSAESRERLQRAGRSGMDAVRESLKAR
jgi:hypothetical protein